MASDLGILLGRPLFNRNSQGRAHVPESSGLLYFGRRLIGALPVAWGVTFVTFVTFALMNLLPGNAAQAALGPNATPAEVGALSTKLGLRHPFFERYFNWLGHLLSGNLGTSLESGQPVSSALKQTLPLSSELVALSVVLALGLAIPVALLSARRPCGVFDRVSALVGVASLSMTPFVLGIALVLMFAVQLQWFPAIGFTPLGQSVGGNLASLTLPSLTLSLPLFGAYSRVLRGDLVDQLLEADYPLTARAKGASPWRVLCRHVLRNSTFGLVTLVALNLGTLLGATVVVEQVFDLPGMGSALLRAINLRDVPTVEAFVLLLSVFVLLTNVLADAAFSLLDPRVRHGRAAH